jgi:hypothetical protein
MLPSSLAGGMDFFKATILPSSVFPAASHGKNHIYFTGWPVRMMKINIITMSLDIRISHMQNNDICLSRAGSLHRRKANIAWRSNIPFLALFGSIVFIFALTAGVIS